MCDMNYCPGCGTQLRREVEGAEQHETEQQTEEITDAAVRIAEIEANKEITIAKIERGIVEKVADVEQAAELAHAEGVAEGMAEAIAPAESAPAEPVVVVNDTDVDEPEPTIAPAEEHHAAPEEKKSAPKRGFF